LVDLRLIFATVKGHIAYRTPREENVEEE
jgi:hypothetical protein